MIVYKCDRCEAEFKSSEDLARVDIQPQETYDSRWLNRSDVKVPYVKDLCRDCVTLILTTLMIQVKR